MSIPLNKEGATIEIQRTKDNIHSLSCRFCLSLKGRINAYVLELGLGEGQGRRGNFSGESS